MRNLEEEINDCFLAVARPQKEQIALHECDECNDLRLIFSDREWQSLDNEIIESCYADLPLLSPAAFTYFLPAFMLYSLRHFGPDSKVVQYVIYSLTPATSNDEWWKERFKLFTDRQMTTIYSFLDLVVNDTRFYQFHRDSMIGKSLLQEYRK